MVFVIKIRGQKIAINAEWGEGKKKRDYTLSSSITH